MLKHLCALLALDFLDTVERVEEAIAHTIIDQPDEYVETELVCVYY